MNRCWIPFEVLADYSEGRADAANVARVRGHLDAGCSSCQHNVAWFERLMPALETKQPLLHVPAASLSRAQGLFRERFSVPKRPSILARFVFDSRTHLTPALARSADSSTFQLLYCTEDHDIDLWQEKLNDRAWYLIGQILSKKGGGAVIPDSATLTSRAGSKLIAVPEMSEFHVPSVPPGMYDLLLQLTDQEIVVPEVVIGS